MRRRRREKPSGGVQMFSFLDAMICTMGALLVLLHAFARHGQIEIAHKSEARTDAGQLRAAREDVELRIEQLKKSRDDTEADLTAERLKLSHVEDHERRLREQLRSLTIAAEKMNQLNNADAGAREKALADLQTAKDQVETARQAVEQGRRAAQQQASAYSVVPYEGPHATRRRPIYIECRNDLVVLQPEEIELVPEDFAGPMGPGNPLASALRATCEYLARQAAAGNDLGEPYPLLLVRPEGIESYYAARAALDSWGSEFGYELVGSDWAFKFAEPDPRLKELTRQVVAEARLRQQEYLASVPNVMRLRSRPKYHASSHGGFSRDPGSRGGGGPGTGGWDTLGSNWARRGSTGVGNGSDTNGTGKSPSSGGLGSGSGSSDGLAGGQAGGILEDGSDTFSGSGTNSAGDMNGRSRGSSGDDSLLGNGRGGARGGRGQSVGGDGATSASNSNANGSRSSRSGQSTATQTNPRVGTSAMDSSASGGGAVVDASISASSDVGPSGGNSTFGRRQGAGGSQSAGTGGGSGLVQAGSNGGSDASGSQASAGGSSSPGSSDTSQMTAGQPSPSFTATNAKKPNSMARNRGRDWGLPETGPASVSATRPIAVECYNDRILILPEASNDAIREIRLGANTQDSMDELVSHVWQHMKGWGMAGKGLYWRPTLWVDVKPGAADRYADMKALLAESGLDVRERQPRTGTSLPLKNPSRR